MFGPAGGLYVYFTYGMHWCANAVCGDEGEGVAVLLRAAAPLTGIDQMYASRGAAARRDRDLCSGPAKLCQAFGLDRAFDGADLVTADRGVTIVDDGVPPPSQPGNSVRVGLTAGAEHPWRWFVPGDPNVSKKVRDPSHTPAGVLHDGMSLVMANAFSAWLFGSPDSRCFSKNCASSPVRSFAVHAARSRSH